MAHHIKQFLQSLLPKEADWKQALLEHWPVIMGSLHSQVTIENIHDDQIVLGVRDSCWLQELYMLSPIIIKHVNEKLDLPRIKKVRFKQISRKTERWRGLVRSAQVDVPKQIHLNAAEQKALGCVGDPDLQAVLASYLIRCYRERG